MPHFDETLGCHSTVHSTGKGDQGFSHLNSYGLNNKKTDSRKIFRFADEIQSPIKHIECIFVVVKYGSGKKLKGWSFWKKTGNKTACQDLVEEAGLLGTNFKLLDKTSRAKLGGYSIFENFVKFVVDPTSIKGMGKDPKIFLASEFNNWLKDNKDSDKWLLKKDIDNNFSLSMACQELPLKSQFPLSSRLPMVYG